MSLKKSFFKGQDLEGEYYDDIYILYENKDISSEATHFLKILTIYSSVLLYISLDENKKEIKFHKSLVRSAWDEKYEKVESELNEALNLIQEKDLMWFLVDYLEEQNRDWSI